MAEKALFRPPLADDLFTMCKIISKIGAQEFKRCIESPGVMEAIKGEGSVDLEKVGVTVMADLGVSVLSHLEDCKQDIYRFLSSLSGIPVTEFPTMRMAQFAGMVIQLFRNEEFRDFFTEVSESFRQETSGSSIYCTSDMQTLNG